MIIRFLAIVSTVLFLGAGDAQGHGPDKRNNHNHPFTEEEEMKVFGYVQKDLNQVAESKCTHLVGKESIRRCVLYNAILLAPSGPESLTCNPNNSHIWKHVDRSCDSTKTGTYMINWEVLGKLGAGEEELKRRWDIFQKWAKEKRKRS